MKTGKRITNPLTVAVAILLCAGISSAQYVPDANLLAAWEFNAGDVSGANVAASGGSAANTTGILQADASAAGGVLTLDGSGDYLQFGSDVADLRGLSAMTLCVWVKAADASTAYRRIVEHEDNIYFWSENGNFRFTIHGSSSQAISTTAPAAGVWQHVLVTYQSGQPAKIYVNGVWEDDSNGNQVAMPSNVQTFQIGARRGGSGGASSFFYGDMDDVAIWNEVLSLSDIERLAGKGAGGYAGRITPTALEDAPSISTEPATAVLANSATLNGELLDGAVPATVKAYWGTSDGGINAAAWGHTNTFGSVAALGSLSTNITGLAEGTLYHYRFFVSNDVGTAWAPAGETFRTAGGKPVVTTDAPSTINPTSATLHGTLVSTGGAPAQVWVYWGTSDGTTNANQWANTNAFGTEAVGALLSRCSALVAGAPARPGAGAHAERVAMIGDRWGELFAAADSAKAASFTEPKFRRHLLANNADNAFRAMARAVAYGVPRAMLADAVGLACADRLLRFDAAIDAAEGREHGWKDVIEALQIAAATARLGRRHERPEWARLLLFATYTVNDLGGLDAPESRRFQLPEPEPIAHTWDHGPEIAKLRARLLRADEGGAIAGLRGYLMLALPVQPLCAQLLDTAFEDFPTTAAGQAAIISTMAAAVELFSALGEHPHRELALCAALRVCPASLGRRTAHLAARRALRPGH